MSIYKLPMERESRAPAAVPGVNISLQQRMDSYIGSAVVRARAVQGCEFDLSRLPIHRTLRWSVRRKLSEFFDDLALDASFASLRVDSGCVLLQAPGAFVYINGYSKGSYTSCSFSLWAESRARADEAVARLESIAGEARMRDETFTLDWQFTNASGELRNAMFQELADPSCSTRPIPRWASPCATSSHATSMRRNAC